LGPKNKKSYQKIASKPYRLLQLALVGCKDGRSSQAGFCHQNVWLKIFVAKCLLSFVMVLLRKKRERKKTNKYRFGGGSTFVQSQKGAQNQRHVSSTT
jgi:hypothetical protein